ncbi:MAG: hypothetical protein Sapg2KO_25920 [Saprospiraceae bacterium]
MKVSVEISMYPLDANYIPPIQGFIDHLNELSSIKVKTNSMSTQVFGEYDAVMSALSIAMKKPFMEDRKISMVLKIINSDLDYDYQNP